MVNFVALNVPPETEIDIENHTKEVQIETGLKLYQRALLFQHVKDWSAVAKAYEELLSLDILNSDSIEEYSNITNERMARLIYLVYKNHGSFIYDAMVSSDFKDNDVSMTLYTCLKDYSIALKYDHTDIALWKKVSEISEKLCLNRIFRFSLESIIYKEMDMLISRKCSNSVLYGNILSPEVYKSLIKLDSLLHFINDSTSLIRVGMFLYNSCNNKSKRSCLNIKASCQERKFDNSAKRAFFFQNDSSSLKIPERSVDSISTELAFFLLNRHEKDDCSFYSRIEFLEKYNQDNESLLEMNHAQMYESQIIATLQNNSEFSEISQKSFEEVNTSVLVSTNSELDNDIDASKNIKKRIMDDENYAKSLRASKRTRNKDGVSLSHEEKDSCFVNSLNEIFIKVGMFFGEYLKFNRPISATLFSENDVIDMLRQNLYSGFLNEDVINDVIQEKNFLSLPKVFYLDLSKHLDISVNINENDDLEIIDEFENFINSGRYMLEEISLEWFKRVTFYSYSDLGTFYFQKKWSSKFNNAIIEIAINLENDCIYFFKDVLGKMTLSDNFSNDNIITRNGVDILQILGWGQTILEIFLNYYVKNERSDYFEKTENYDLIFQRQRICRWRLLVSDLMLAYGISFDTLENNENIVKLLLRHKFCNAIILEYFGALHESVIKEYQDIKDYMLYLGNVSVIYFPNCEVISEISLSRIDLEISKLKTVDFFTSVFVSSRLMEYKLVIEKLKPVLQGSSEFGNLFQFSLVEEFLLKAPIDFKLQLWNLLQNAYHNLSQFGDALWCCLKALSFVVVCFDSSLFKISATGQQKTIFILKRLFSAYQLISYALQCVIDQDNILSFLSTDIISESLSSLLVILRLLLIFCFFEDSIVDNNSCIFRFSSNEAFDNKLHNMQVRSWCFAYCLYKEILSRTKTDVDNFYKDITKFLCLIHEELGIRGYCSLSDGILLKILQKELLNSSPFFLTSEIIQCLHCRFGLSFGTDNFYPFDHYTEPFDIDCFSAEQILPFILSLVNRRRSGLTLPRADIKNVLDKIYTVLESSPNSKISNSFNFALIEAYLHENIRLNDIISCQYGLLKNNTMETKYSLIDLSVLSLSDINYVQAEIHISMFRARGKTTLVRNIDDLELALKYLMADLSLNPLRISSWHALGLTFGWLSDSELTWSAEYIQNERKSISELKKKSLKAYMMAYSLFISFASVADENFIHFFSNLHYDFGMQLYTSLHPPLDMDPFISKSSRFHDGPDGLLKHEVTNDISYYRIIELAMKCFFFASKNMASDWRCFYMLGKTLGKLNRDPRQVLDQYVRAIKLVPRKNALASHVIIIEPDYKLVSSIVKYIRAGLIDLKIAITYLQESAYNDNIFESEKLLTENDVIEICLVILNRIRLADKKHWHHRPVFRCANILESQLKLQLAKDELETLFSIKSLGKSLINIWRPDFERPGRHFYYAEKYTLYFIKLLDETNDRDGLKHLLKRLRKASSSIYHHRQVWERLCSVYLNLIRQNSSILTCPTIVWNITLLNFNFIASKLEEQLLNSIYLDEHGIDDIRDVMELKKINGGLYNVEIVDQFLVDSYFKLYLSFFKKIIQEHFLADNIGSKLNEFDIVSNDSDIDNGYKNINEIIAVIFGDYFTDSDKFNMADNNILISQKDVLSRLPFFCKNNFKDILKENSLKVNDSHILQ
ncbi:hypothetical protein T552_03070 [Pneumocystis carinii B80]|uniref:Histone transcription regulator 3 homolog n=1 Tax=Pneumocystis carinii (strain B80) TaxID=1408658 RepID=A0A0W4ZCW4_PNEC8|nr:hypothetical protein T552_03070 [Pneumocystis carinii B80]KTW26179.1 hypothetical protein T552_03070 [Pneumocystis carinii B80]